MSWKNEKIATVMRYLLGLMLVVFGSNYFLKFMSAPEMTGAAATVFAGLMAMKYLMPLVKVMEIAIGLMLLSNKKVPLALVLLAPLSVNFVIYHLSVDVAGGLIAYVTAIFNIYLIEMHWDNFKPLLE